MPAAYPYDLHEHVVDTGSCAARPTGGDYKSGAALTPGLPGCGNPLGKPPPTIDPHTHRPILRLRRRSQT